MDVNAYALDANAIAGDLFEIFGRDMTVVVCECAHCGNKAQLGALRVYLAGPGVVVRCVVCEQMVLRFRPLDGGGHRVDTSGAVI